MYDCGDSGDVGDSPMASSERPLSGRAGDDGTTLSQATVVVIIHARVPGAVKADGRRRATRRRPLAVACRRRAEEDRAGLADSRPRRGFWLYCHPCLPVCYFAVMICKRQGSRGARGVFSRCRHQSPLLLVLVLVLVLLLFLLTKM